MTNEYPDLFECMPVEHMRTPIAKRALVVYGHSEVGIEIGTALERCCLSADVVRTGLEAIMSLKLYSLQMVTAFVSLFFRC